VIEMEEHKKRYETPKVRKIERDDIRNIQLDDMYCPMDPE
jgi:hypothetical protein